MIRLVYCGTVALSLFLTNAFFQQTAIAHKGATGIIKERMDEFSHARFQLKQLRQAAQAKEFETISAITSDMLDWAERMPDAFPVGSDGAPSEAAPTIWSDPQGFAAAIARYEGAIRQLNQSALRQDHETLMPAFRELGASCKACHQRYRQ